MRSNGRLPRPAGPDARRWLSIAIAMTVALAGLCFALLLLVDRRYGWPAYAALFSASVFTVLRDRVADRLVADEEPVRVVGQRDVRQAIGDLGWERARAGRGPARRTSAGASGAASTAPGARPTAASVASIAVPISGVTGMPTP